MTIEWNKKEITNLFKLPLLELLFRAQNIHKKNFHNNEIELCSLLSVKTGACPEDCAYCPQSGHYQTGLEREKVLDLTKVMEKATEAKKNGATRFCMGAAWRQPPEKEFNKIIDMVVAVKNIGLETCVTLGMLNLAQAQKLKQAGLDFYNHNLDTSPEFYKKIISTRTYQQRLETLANVRQSGIKVCCGGILGMGETRKDRIEFLLQLVNLPEPPESVPINRLVPIKGTPLSHVKNISNFEFIRTIAVTRILLPRAVVRLSAGRASMSAEMQTLCFMAGANSIWWGDKLLVTANSKTNADIKLLKEIGVTPKSKSCYPN